jgi:hypothetical protein
MQVVLLIWLDIHRSASDMHARRTGHLPSLHGLGSIAYLLSHFSPTLVWLNLVLHSALSQVLPFLCKAAT